MNRFRKYLTFANVVSLIALFVALGGTAMAAVIITSNSQVGKDTISGHEPPSGDHANIIADSITGTDIANRSGVDTCQTHLVKKLGAICAGSDGAARKWTDAAQYCSDFGLRLPSVSEALTLAKNYPVPGVDSSQYFSPDDLSFDSGAGHDLAIAVGGDGITFPFFAISHTRQTVCVTDPSA